MTRNQTLERFYFERFAQTGFLPEGHPTYADKPDVLWQSDRTIGVEITRLHVTPGHLESSEQRQQPLRVAVVSAAQKLFSALDTRGLELWVTFDTKHPITSVRRKELTRQLAELARSFGHNGRKQVDFDLLDKIPEVYSVYWNGHEYSDAKWRPSQVHTVKFMSIERLENAIKEKEIKASEYTPCDVYWLLIIVDWRDPAQEQEIRIDAKIASHVFEKIFVYKPIFEHVTQVWP
jgi:hypothetical protein